MCREPQVVRWPAFAFCRRRGGPYFQRHYVRILSLTARALVGDSNDNRVRQATELRFVLFPFVGHGENRMLMDEC
jgi:hypothetical protein